MNREIKFRAWDKGVKTMLYTGFAIYPKGQVTFYWNPLPVHSANAILMQYTSLKDGFGKEIYEGDIVNVDNSDPEEDGEYDVTTVCKWDFGCFILEDQAGGHWTRQLFHQPHRLTIIGNIYETPQLLNSGQEVERSVATGMLNEQKDG